MISPDKDSQRLSTEVIPILSPETKHRLITQLIQQLSTIQGPTEIDDAHIFSNDIGIEKFIPSIQEAVKDAPGSIKVGIVVSNGGPWSLPKELDPSIDVFLRINSNPNQLIQDQARRAQILAAKNVAELLPPPDPNLNSPDTIAARKAYFATQVVETERKSYRDYHYLSSLEQLHKTQAFLLKDNIVFIGGNLTDHPFTQQLQTTLNQFQAQVVFADLSNVMDWIGGSRRPVERQHFLDSLKQLPFTLGAAILHSTHAGMAGRSPIYSQVSFGLHKYSRDAR